MAAVAVAVAAGVAGGPAAGGGEGGGPSLEYREGAGDEPLASVLCGHVQEQVDRLARVVDACVAEYGAGGVLVDV